jgi:hypothetical protein
LTLTSFHFSTAADADEFEVPIHHVELQDSSASAAVEK